VIAQGNPMKRDPLEKRGLKYTMANSGVTIAFASSARRVQRS
jgi:hypothetical protein